MSEEIKKKRGRPRKPAKVDVPDAPPVDVKNVPDATLSSFGDVLSGVSITGLSRIFHQDKKTISRKLANVKPCGKKRGHPVYDIAEAAEWLVKPQIDVESYMRSLRPADLPPWLQREFWDAMNKRQKWEENAGDLWRTDKVIKFLSEVYRNMKNSIMLWNNALEEKGIGDEDRAYYRSMTDGLLDELYTSLIKLDGEDVEEYLPQTSEKPVPGDYPETEGDDG